MSDGPGIGETRPQLEAYLQEYFSVGRRRVLQEASADSERNFDDLARRPNPLDRIVEVFRIDPKRLIAGSPGPLRDVLADLGVEDMVAIDGEVQRFGVRDAIKPFLPVRLDCALASDIVTPDSDYSRMSILHLVTKIPAKIVPGGLTTGFRSHILAFSDAEAYSRVDFRCWAGVDSHAVEVTSPSLTRLNRFLKVDGAHAAMWTSILTNATVRARS